MHPIDVQWGHVVKGQGQIDGHFVQILSYQYQKTILLGMLPLLYKQIAWTSGITVFFRLIQIVRVAPLKFDGLESVLSSTQ